MSLKLTRFSQECDVESDAMQVSYFAIFQKDDGQELKLPISAEASQAIIAFVADKNEKKAGAASIEDELRESSEEEVAVEEDRQFATTFGGEDDEQAEDPEDDSPESEEQVPSV